MLFEPLPILLLVSIAGIVLLMLVLIVAGVAFAVHLLSARHASQMRDQDTRSREREEAHSRGAREMASDMQATSIQALVRAMNDQRSRELQIIIENIARHNDGRYTPLVENLSHTLLSGDNDGPRKSLLSDTRNKSARKAPWPLRLFRRSG